MEHQNIFSHSVLSKDFDNNLVAPPSFFVFEEQHLHEATWLDESPSSQNCSSPSGNISNIHSIDSLSESVKLDQFQNQGEQEFNLQNKVHQTTTYLSSMAPEEPSDDQSENCASHHHSRADDSNNAHKKLITQLLKILTSRQKRVIRDNFKKFNKLEKLDAKKGSRYGFPCYLIIIRNLLGEDALLQTYERYRGLSWNEFILAASTKQQARIYLEQLIPKYSMAFSYMIEKDIEKSVNQIYDLKDFKQVAYRKKGLQYVRAFNEKLTRLLDLADLNNEL